MVLGGLDFAHQDSTSPGVKGYYKCFSEDGGTDVYHAWGVSGGETVSEALRITSRRKVGIGTSDPSSTLEISGDGISTTFQGETISAGTTERLRIGYRSGGPESGLTCGQIIEDTNTLHIAGRDTSNGDIIFHAGGSVPEVMRLEASSGNVGIGTDDPDYPLDIGGQHARIGDSRVGIIQYGSNSDAVKNFHLGAVQTEYSVLEWQHRHWH